MKFKENLPEPTVEDLDDTVPEYFFYLLFQTARRKDVAFDAAFRPLNLSSTRARSLGIIRRVENCTMNALAKLSTVDRTTLTREVDHLVEEGYVTRSVPADDRRRVNLALTEKGEALYQQGMPVLSALNRRILGDVEPARLRSAARILQSLLRNMVDEPELAEDVITFARSHKLKPLK